MDAIATYRAITGTPEINSGIAWRKAEGTVAFAVVDGSPLFGVSSNAPGYTVTDELAAISMRTKLVERYPDIMRLENLGWKPNDALYHAEANALLRAAEAHGGSLAGRTIEISVDRPLCSSCASILPKIGTELGDPEVRIIDGRGDLWITINGIWTRRGK